MKATDTTLLTVFLLAGAALAGPPEKSARNVVMRGGTDLGRILVAATRSARAEPERVRPVLFVVDVTPFTALAGPLIERALDDLGDEISTLSGSWRLARLGEAPGPAFPHPARLGVEVGGALAGETPEANTIRALTRTLEGFPERDGLIVYLADWRFEDDEGLEPFVLWLRSRRQTLTVVGPEAGFGRAWNDGFYPPGRGERLAPNGGILLYDPAVGRDPFGPPAPEAPWHGGDTAFPHQPFHLRGFPWQTRHHARLPADLLARLRRAARGEGEVPRPGGDGPTDDFFYPLPSSWGPWSLMRACAETDGKYHLWSWNRWGRPEVNYNWSRCNQFPPDLRSRHAILADLPGRPLAVAMLRAWRLLAVSSTPIATVTPPLGPELREPRAMEEVPCFGALSFSFFDAEDHASFLERATLHLGVLDQAIGWLETALAGTEDADQVDARYRADADLFLHVLRVARFSIGEARAAARELPADTWRDPGRCPSLTTETWLEWGDAPNEVRPKPVQVFDEEAGRRLAEQRREFLRRYLGTPFGEAVAQNSVYTYHLVVRPRGSARGSAPGTTAGSRAPRPSTPGSGGSTGGGPSTGR